MSLPPADEPEGPIVRPSEGRPFVWLILAALFVFLIASTLYGIARPDALVLDETHKLDSVLKELQTNYALQVAARRADRQEAGALFMAEAERKLMEVPVEKRGTNGRRARALLILRQELLGEEPNFSDLNAEVDDVENERIRPEVQRGRAEVNAALRDLYRAESLTRQEADAIINTIRTHAGGKWPYPLAVEQARELAGLDGQIRMVVAGILGLAIIFSGVTMWGIYLALHLGGRARPKGVPLQGASKLAADSLGARMLLFLGAFMFVPVIAIGWAPEAVRESIWVRAGAMALVLIVAVGFSARSFFGERISLSDIGLRSRGLGADILWGLGGWLANWPIIVVLMFVGLFISPYIPSADHPISEQMLDPGAFLPILIQAAIFAPFLEEFFFRGCLYQGLQLRLKSVFWPILLSSFAFAAVHPQGAAMWLALAWVGAMGALLTRQRASLVPAMVMHAAHNGSILFLVNYVGGLG